MSRASGIYRRRTASGQRVTGTALARELGISDGYARRLLRSFALETNGS